MPTFHYLIVTLRPDGQRRPGEPWSDTIKGGGDAPDLETAMQVLRTRLPDNVEVRVSHPTSDYVRIWSPEARTSISLHLPDEWIGLPLPELR